MKLYQEKPYIMNKVIVHPHPDADTRTASASVTEAALLDASKDHITDVQNIANVVTSLFTEAVKRHDFTKIEYISMFHQDFVATKQGRGNFVELPWYNLHITKERHHPKERCADNINLLDIMEHICDIVVASKARNGEKPFEYREIDPKILIKAYNNTIAMLLDHVEVGDPK